MRITITTERGSLSAEISEEVYEVISQEALGKLVTRLRNRLNVHGETDGR